MSAFGSIVYVLCTATSGLCTYLLLRAYRLAREPILVWSGLCFLLLTLNNAVVFADYVTPQIDLSLWRVAVSLAAVSVLIFGFVWHL